MSIVQTRTTPKQSSSSRAVAHAIPHFTMKAVRTLLHCLTSLRAAAGPAPLAQPAPDLAEACAAKPADNSTSSTNSDDFRSRIPKGSWDSHMHVLDPRFPLAPDAQYTPNWHTTADARAFEATVGLDKIVIVQPSIYDDDNSCTLDGLRTLGSDRARAVVAFDPATTSAETLRDWHELGVRGVRLNLQSVGREIGADELAAVMGRYADAVRPLGWVIQVYAGLPTIALLEPLVPRLGVRIVVDHLGHPDLAGDAPANATHGDNATTTAAGAGADPYTLPGFDALVRLLRGGHTYVKLSAAYRFSGAADGMSDAVPLVREVLRVAGRDRAVFATDWPHTRYEGLDIRPWVRLILDLCDGDDALVERVFRGNADDLWNAPAAPLL